MPWSRTSPMDQKTQFIADQLCNSLSMSKLCHLYGVSRKTACKWIERYLQRGRQDLEERSRRPQSSPNQTPPEVVKALLELRRRHPSC
jgi:putative transposase